MNVHAVTTSVDYAPELAHSIDLWLGGLASLIVVTAPRDEATIELARKSGARLHVTDAFYEDGAHLNKGRAMQQARSLLPAEDWHLFIDADVIPPEKWLDTVWDADPKVGRLHGAVRVGENGEPIHDRELAGFFHLFHSSDSRAAAPLARDFTHSGNYDTLFMRRWPRTLQRILPLTLTHLGEPRTNWCGKGNAAAMAELHQRRRSKHWKTEIVGSARE